MKIYRYSYTCTVEALTNILEHRKTQAVGHWDMSRGLKYFSMHFSIIFWEFVLFYSNFIEICTEISEYLNIYKKKKKVL